jgi:hypothetical protein
LRSTQDLQVDEWKPASHPCFLSSFAHPSRFRILISSRARCCSEKTRTERCRNAHNDPLPGEFNGQINLVSRRAFDQDIQVGDAVAHLHEDRSGGVEASALAARSWKGRGQTTGHEHDGKAERERVDQGKSAQRLRY